MWHVQTTATCLQPLLVAAHQPIYGLWSLLTFAHVPTEQAALAYLPGVSSQREASELMWVLLVLGAAIGTVTAVAAGVVPIFAPQIFSPDARLWPHMRAVVPQVSGNHHAGYAAAFAELTNVVVGLDPLDAVVDLLDKSCLLLQYHEICHMTCILDLA